MLPVSDLTRVSLKGAMRQGNRDGAST